MGAVTGRAAIFTGAGQPLVVDEVTWDAPGAGEVLVRLTASGVCHTDVSVIDGLLGAPAPGILGHEGAGVVEQLGAGVTSVAVGDAVLLSFTSCGDCPACRRGAPASCDTFGARNVGGALRPEDSGGASRSGTPLAAHFFGQSSFGQYALADERSIVPVPAKSDLAALAPLGCGVLTGAGSMWNVLDPGPGDIVAIWGAGAVGLSALMAAAVRSPAQLIAIDLVDARLELARELGATATINPGSEDVAERLRELTGERGVDKSFDSTGSARVARDALDASAVGGTVVVCGIAREGSEIAVDARDLLAGRTLRGVTMGDADPRELIPQLIALHAEGRLPIERLQTSYGLDEIAAAVDGMRSGAVIKPVVRM